MQLLPQHFQQLEMRMESLANHVLMSAQPYFWGVQQLELNTAALQYGQLEVLSVRGTFQDGTAFSAKKSIPWSQIQPLALQLNDSRETYAIAIPVMDYDFDGRQIRRWCQAHTEPVSDAFDREFRIVVSRRAPNLRLMRWDPEDSLHLQIPVATVIKEADGYSLSNELPTCTAIPMDSPFAKQLQGLVVFMRKSLVGLRMDDPKSSWHAQAVAVLAELTRLECWSQSLMGHPYQALLYLCGVLARISSVSPKASLNQPPPPYQHERPSNSLGYVLEQLEKVLHEMPLKHASTVVESKGNQEELQCQIVDSCWLLDLPLQWTSTKVVFTVNCASNSNEQVLSSALDRALICWKDDEKRHRETRIRGFARQVQALPKVKDIGHQFSITVSFERAPKAYTRQVVIDFLQDRNTVAPLSVTARSVND